MKRLISLLLLFCIGLPLLAQQQRPAQTPKRDQKKKEVAEIDTIPLYNGTYVGVDLYGIGSKLLGGDFMSSEVSVAVNLKNKFIPTIEFGMGGTDTWSETGIHYKSKMAPFFRIGVDYNTMAKKKEKNSYLYAGLRYAFSSFKYDVSTMPADDPIWGRRLLGRKCAIQPSGYERIGAMAGNRFRRQSTYLQKLQHGVVSTYEIQNQSIYRRIWRPMVRARLRKV